MQIKKVDWINKPEKVKVTAHSLTFITEKRCALLYTLEKDGELKLVRHNGNVSFLMLHTKNDRIILERESVDIRMFSLNSTITLSVPDEISVRKTGDTIAFSASGSVLIRLSNPAFLDSASFGFLIEGSKEEISIELF